MTTVLDLGIIKRRLCAVAFPIRVELDAGGAPGENDHRRWKAFHRRVDNAAGPARWATRVDDLLLGVSQRYPSLNPRNRDPGRSLGSAKRVAAGHVHPPIAAPRIGKPHVNHLDVPVISVALA